MAFGKHSYSAIRWHQPGGLGQDSPVCTLNKCPICGAVSPIARIQGFRNQGVEKGIVSVTVILSDPLRKILFPVFMTLSYAGLGDFIPGEGVHSCQEPQQTSDIPLATWDF